MQRMGQNRIIRNDVLNAINAFLMEIQPQDEHRINLPWEDDKVKMYRAWRWALITLKKEILKSTEPPLVVMERLRVELYSYTVYNEDFMDAYNGITEFMRRLNLC